jgi:hypothetical protein
MNAILTELAQSIGPADFGVEVDTPRALYGLWLSRAGLSNAQLNLLSVEARRDVLRYLDHLATNPAALVGERLWNRLGMENSRAVVVQLILERRQVFLNEHVKAYPLGVRSGDSAPKRIDEPADVIKSLEFRDPDPDQIDQYSGDSTLSDKKPGLVPAESDPMLRVQIMERKYEVWRGFLARESVATIVGAILLLSLALAVTLAMFMAIQVTDIVANSFLIVLGYFFGQIVGAKSGEVSTRNRVE